MRVPFRLFQSHGSLCFALSPRYNRNSKFRKSCCGWIKWWVNKVARSYFIVCITKQTRPQFIYAKLANNNIPVKSSLEAKKFATKLLTSLFNQNVFIMYEPIQRKNCFCILCYKIIHVLQKLLFPHGLC